MNLTAPTQRFFGRLIDLNPAGITIRGVDLDAFEDWMDNIATDEESGVKPTTTFFPLHRVEKMVVDEGNGAIPSLSRLSDKGGVPCRGLTGVRMKSQ